MVSRAESQRSTIGWRDTRLLRDYRALHASMCPRLTMNRRWSAFFAVAAAQVSPAEATARAMKGQPKGRPVPPILLARLAVDQAHQRTGVGRSLLQQNPRSAIRLRAHWTHELPAFKRRSRIVNVPLKRYEIGNCSSGNRRGDAAARLRVAGAGMDAQRERRSSATARVSH